MVHDYYAYYKTEGGCPGRRHLVEDMGVTNTTHMSEVFHHLPSEIIHMILSYNETIKIRNGRYMNQIRITDARYRMLLTIPRKHFSYTFTQVDIKRTHRMIVSWRGEYVKYRFDNVYAHPCLFSNSIFQLW